MAHHPLRPTDKAGRSLKLAPPPGDQPDNRVPVARHGEAWLDGVTNNA